MAELKQKKPNKKYYIDGFQNHQARKVCAYFFGDYFIGIKLNEAQWCFDISLRKSIKINGKDTPITEFLNISDFKEFWGPQWKLYLYEENQVA